MKYTKEQLTNFFEWDVYNWSKSLKVWEKHLDSNELFCLGLGERNGGLSLYLAEKGYKVICSDLKTLKQ